MRWALSALILVFSVSGCSFGGDDESESAVASSEFVTELIRLGREGEHGRVGISAAGSKTTIVVELSDPGEESLNAEVRRGNCDVIDGATAYPLQPVTAGVSRTVVDVPLAHLRQTGYLVLVGLASQHFGVSGLCADLAQSQPPSAAPTFD
jgi:hypothetical protein